MLMFAGAATEAVAEPADALGSISHCNPVAESDADTGVMTPVYEELVLGGPSITKRL